MTTILNFCYKRTTTFHNTYGTASAHTARTSVEEHSGWILNLHKAVLAHLEYTDLERSTEAVFDARQDAVAVIRVALELEHDIDDVFQNLRAGNRAVLGDVADDEDGRAGRLGVFQERSGTFSDL